jgi:putative membrane protein
MHTDLARHTRYTMMAAAWLGTLAMGACKGRTNTTDSGRVEAPATADTGTSGMAAPADTAKAATPAATLTDPNIVALLDEANQADSAAGAFALSRAADPSVKAFAKLMMGEHHALRVQGLALAKKLKVTPEPPANDPVQTAGSSEMDALRSAGTGAAFDRAYIDQEVTIHKAVIELADRAHGDAQNAELKALIEKAKPTLQKHLDRAQELQKKLGNATT